MVQRVSAASVDVVDERSGEVDRSFAEQSIGAGLVLLVGVADSDGAQEVAYAARKIAGMRIFEDESGKMNRSVVDTGGIFSRFLSLRSLRIASTATDPLL